MPRGAGTCNWGQGIPLAGGAVLDMTGVNRLVRHEGHTVRVEPGMICHDIDRATQPKGQELRMHPSTRYSTIGGFVGGGHVGLGSCTWGILRDLGNIQRVEVVSVEEEPRVVELKGAEVNRVHHAYGSNGIITEIEFPLAPAYGWTEAIVDFADFLRACDFGITLNRSDGIVPKMVAMNEWRYAKLFTQTGLGGILADDMGLGKTAQVLAHLLIEQQAGRDLRGGVHHHLQHHERREHARAGVEAFARLEAGDAESGAVEHGHDIGQQSGGPDDPRTHGTGPFRRLGWSYHFGCKDGPKLMG